MCNKECFANLDGVCLCLDEPYEGDCPFQRNDINMKDQYDAIKRYSSRASVGYEQFTERSKRTR